MLSEDEDYESVLEFSALYLDFFDLIQKLYQG